MQQQLPTAHRQPNTHSLLQLSTCRRHAARSFSKCNALAPTHTGTHSQHRLLLTANIQPAASGQAGQGDTLLAVQGCRSASGPSALHPSCCSTRCAHALRLPCHCPGARICGLSNTLKRVSLRMHCYCCKACSSQALSSPTQSAQVGAGSCGAGVPQPPIKMFSNSNIQLCRKLLMH